MRLVAGTIFQRAAGRPLVNRPGAAVVRAAAAPPTEVEAAAHQLTPTMAADGPRIDTRPAQAAL